MPGPPENTAPPEDTDSDGKRVSWAELYFDLVFAFAAGQTAEIMVNRPSWTGLGYALGLFFTLWWTWIGFVVLCNRYQDRSAQRLFVLAGTLPCAVAAVETHAAADGRLMAFTFALAAARALLAAAFASSSSAARQVAAGYAVSTAAFVASAFVPSPWRYLLWAFALIQEAGFLLLRDGELARKRPDRRAVQGRPQRSTLGRGTREPGAARRSRPSRADQMRAVFESPVDPERQVDAGHLAERFGAMIIILLGEVVVSVAASVAGIDDHDPQYWAGLLAGLVLAGALFWIYFTAAAPLSEAVLRASGGNPSMAYGLYAAGNFAPAFALLAIAAGVSLTISGHGGQHAAWFVTGGLACFMIGGRPPVDFNHPRLAQAGRATLAALTAVAAVAEPVISADGVVIAIAVWAVLVAAYVTWKAPARLKATVDDPLSFFRPSSPSGTPGPRP